MSMVVSNGLVFDMTIDEMVKFFKNLKPTISAITDAKQAKYLAESVVSKLDFALAKNEKLSFYSAFSKVRDDYKADVREIKVTGYRNPLVDFECIVRTYPLEGKLYGYISCEHGEMIKAIKKDPRVGDFSFWDNSDKPSRVKKADWDERRRVWNSVFDNGGISFDVDLTKPYFQNCGVGRDLIQNSYPSKEDRAKRVAEMLVVMPKSFNPAASSFISDYMDFMRSDEAKAQMADTVARLLPILPDTYE